MRRIGCSNREKVLNWSKGERGHCGFTNKRWNPMKASDWPMRSLSLNEAGGGGSSGSQGVAGSTLSFRVRVSPSKALARDCCSRQWFALSPLWSYEDHRRNEEA